MTIETQNRQIFEWLKNGNRVNQLMSYEQFGCTRLAARIYDLKQMGHTIGKYTIVTPNKKQYAEYYLQKEKEHDA
mgnify:FL=1|tara:strand:- start:1111 stop:1335 length:225 start_codon:yes stop_codon:yes gene_type:complete